MINAITDLSFIRCHFRLDISRNSKKSISIDVKNILSKIETSKTLSLVKKSIKILLLPTTIPTYLVNKLFSKIATSLGLGTKEQLRHISQVKRFQLFSIRGEEICFRTHTNSLLEGMFFKTDLPTAKTKTILICSGSHQSYEKYVNPMVDAFISMGHNVMAFNYEGFGKSEGEACEASIYRSTEAAYHYLKQERGCKDEDIVAWGYSLGSAAVTDLGSKHKINIVLDRGFSSMSEVAYQKAPFGFKSLARVIFNVGASFKNLNKLDKVKGKILIAQGITDTTMSLQHHGKPLQMAVSGNSRATYLNVNSHHFHTDTQVWFTKGKDREDAQYFLDTI